MPQGEFNAIPCLRSSLSHADQINFIVGRHAIQHQGIKECLWYGYDACVEDVPCFVSSSKALALQQTPELSAQSAGETGLLQLRIRQQA
jgi:hypothetical protein